MTLSDMERELDRILAVACHSEAPDYGDISETAKGILGPAAALYLECDSFETGKRILGSDPQIWLDVSDQTIVQSGLPLHALKFYSQVIAETAEALIAYAPDPGTAAIEDGRWDRWRNAQVRYYNTRQALGRGQPLGPPPGFSQEGAARLGRGCVLLILSFLFAATSMASCTIYR